MSLGSIDYVVLALYFVFVLGIGFFMRRKVETSADFLTSHRSVPVWITSLAFILLKRSGMQRNSNTVRANDPLGVKHESIEDCV